MKKSIFTLFIMCLFSAAIGQVDTIYKRNNQKVACKIIEVNEYEIKYKMVGLEDGPLVIIDRSSVIRYRLSNGFSEMLLPDELSLEHEHGEILGNRSVIKIHPFSFVDHKLSFAYEKVIKVGMNLDVEVGYSNSNINPSTIIFQTGNSFNTGAYVKPGLKFFLGQDYSVKGLRYAHPLKGRYIKLDFAISYLNYNNIRTLSYNNSANNYLAIKRDIDVISYGGFVNFGRQFILGNLFTMEYYFGAGFTGISSNSKNVSSSVVGTNSYGSVYGNYSNINPDGSNVSNFHGFLRVPTVGLSFTGGFRIGYIIPSKAAHSKSNKTSTSN